jgi:hypothetical protein
LTKFAGCLLFIALLISCNDSSRPRASEQVRGMDPVANQTEEAGRLENNTAEKPAGSYTGEYELLNDTDFIRFLKPYGYNSEYGYLNVKTKTRNEISLLNRKGEILDTIPMGTLITVLGEDSDYPYDYYLVKIYDKNELWSGWIGKKSLGSLYPPIERLRDLPREKGRIPPLRTECISPDNKVFAGWNESYEILFVNNYGDVLLNLKSEQIFPEKKARDVIGPILGWSDDSQNVWFESSRSFIYVRLLNNTYTVFTSPVSSFMGDYSLDFNTGDCYYTDFDRTEPQARNPDVERENWKNYLDQTFHVYKYNFFTEETIELDSAYGMGFEIIKEGNNITYHSFEVVY